MKPIWLHPLPKNLFANTIEREASVTMRASCVKRQMSSDKRQIVNKLKH